MSSVVPRRTALYVPGSNVRAVEKAPHLGADVVIFDLEDAVAPDAKAEARRRVAEALAAPAGSERVVRVNGLDTPWGAEDLAVAVAARPDAILIPKVSSGAEVGRVRAAIRAMDGAAAISLWAMIETPRAVLNPLDIAASRDERLPLAAFVLGLNDLSRETGTRQVPGRAPMLPWMMNTLAAARITGLAVLDGVFNDIADMAGFAAECAAARDCGFDGKTVIHPAQIAPCNAAFSPSGEELAEAERIVTAFALPENAGRGAIALGGRMVERLHADIAARRIAFAAAIARRQAMSDDDVAGREAV